MTGQWTQHFWHIIAPSLWSPVLILLFCSGSYPRLEHLHSWENEHKRNCPNWPFWENKTKTQTFLFPPRLPRNQKPKDSLMSSVVPSSVMRIKPSQGEGRLCCTAPFFFCIYSRKIHLKGFTVQTERPEHAQAGSHTVKGSCAFLSLHPSAVTMDRAAHAHPYVCAKGSSRHNVQCISTLLN